MPLRFVKAAMKAKDLPEVRIVARFVVGLVGVFVLWPVVTNIRNLSALTVTDYFGLAVFSGVGVWLLSLAVRGWE